MMAKGTAKSGVGGGKGRGRNRDPAGCVSSREGRFSARDSYTCLTSSKGDLIDYFSNLVNYKSGIIQ